MNDLAPINHQELIVLQRPNKKQKKFIEYWLDPTSDTFSNAYQSAQKAGYTEKTARIITGNARNLQWVQDAKQLLVKQMQPEHIYGSIQELALSSPAPRDRLKALELMSKIKHLFDDNRSEVNITFNNSVPRPDITPTEEENTTTGGGGV